MLRIGHGFDIHQFEQGKPLILGGVTIPYPKGMKAHSDGDVLLHAICDALIGSIALGDIGKHFPDHDQAYQSMSSRIFLREVHELLVQEGFQINNIDSTIVAEAPKLAPYINDMRANIAEDLKIDISYVSVKAKTMEGLDAVGRNEAISADAVVLLSKRV